MLYIHCTNINAKKYIKNQKESNKILEKSKGTLTSIPQGKEDPEVRTQIVHHIIDQGHPIK